MHIRTKHQVLSNCQVSENLPTLWDMAQAHPHYLVRSAVGDLLPIKSNLPSGGVDNPRYYLQKRRFPCTIRPQKTNNFSAVYFNVNVLQDLDTSVTGKEVFDL